MKFNWFRKRPKSNSATLTSRRRQQHREDQPDFVLINTTNPFNGVDPLADVRVKIIADEASQSETQSDSDSTGE